MVRRVDDCHLPAALVHQLANHRNGCVVGRLSRSSENLVQCHSSLYYYLPFGLRRNPVCRDSSNLLGHRRAVRLRHHRAVLGFRPLPSRLGIAQTWFGSALAAPSVQHHGRIQLTQQILLHCLLFFLLCHSRLFVPFVDFLEDVREVSGFDGSANTIHRINHDDVFQSVELWAVQYDFTCRFAYHHALSPWRWWYDDSALWERDRMDSFDCLP